MFTHCVSQNPGRAQREQCVLPHNVWGLSWELVMAQDDLLAGIWNHPEALPLTSSSSRRPLAGSTGGVVGCSLSSVWPGLLPNMAASGWLSRLSGNARPTERALPFITFARKWHSVTSATLCWIQLRRKPVSIPEEGKKEREHNLFFQWE